MPIFEKRIGTDMPTPHFHFSMVCGFKIKISHKESVSSHHFVDKTPTELHWDPELYQDYDYPLHTSSESETFVFQQSSIES